MNQLLTNQVCYDSKHNRVESATCTLENGYTFNYVTMPRGGMLSIVDERNSSSTMPVAMITGLPLYSNIDEVSQLVEKAIRLYQGHQIISIAGSLLEFEKTFTNIA